MVLPPLLTAGLFLGIAVARAYYKRVFTVLQSFRNIEGMPVITARIPSAVCAVNPYSAFVVAPFEVQDNPFPRGFADCESTAVPYVFAQLLFANSARLALV